MILKWLILRVKAGWNIEIRIEVSGQKECFIKPGPYVTNNRGVSREISEGKEIMEASIAILLSRSTLLGADQWGKALSVENMPLNKWRG